MDGQGSQLGDEFLEAVGVVEPGLVERGTRTREAGMLARYGPASAGQTLGALPVLAAFSRKLDIAGIIGRGAPVRPVARATEADRLGDERVQVQPPRAGLAGRAVRPAYRAARRTVRRCPAGGIWLAMPSIKTFSP